jgi:hypothetical protein
VTKVPAFSSFGARPPLWREARVGLEAAVLLRDPIFRGDGMADGRAVADALESFRRAETRRRPTAGARVARLPRGLG